MLARTLACSLVLVGCSMSSSPPPSRGLYAPVPGPTTASIAPSGPTAPAIAPAATAANGVMRIDASSTRCEVVGVEADGGATLLCTFERGSTCALRHVGPDGGTRSQSESAPGTCLRWAPRADGGGFLATMADDARSVTLTNLDANGHRLARGALTSKDSVYVSDMRIGDDRGLIVALSFRHDLAFRGKRLGTTKFSTSGFVNLRPTLDRIAWSRMLDTRRTYITALLPPTRDGVDAVINTRGPLVEGAPVNPPINPEDGSVFGGDTYGWRAERVAFDRGGTAVARADVSPEPTNTIIDATQVDTTLAVITSDPKRNNRMNLTLSRDGERETVPLGVLPTWRLSDAAGTAWAIECDCTYDPKQGKLVGPWIAREIGGTRRTFPLRVAANAAHEWSSIAVRDDHVVAVGTGQDPTTGMPVTFTALAQMPSPTAALDLSTLTLVDKTELAPACRKQRENLMSLVAPDQIAALDPQLEACGVAPMARVAIYTYSDGGLRTFTIDKATPKVVACARRVFEPLVACPLLGNNVSFAVRRTTP